MVSGLVLQPLEWLDGSLVVIQGNAGVGRYWDGFRRKRQGEEDGEKSDPDSTEDERYPFSPVSYHHAASHLREIISSFSEVRACRPFTGI